jgi:putative transposase
VNNIAALLITPSQRRIQLRTQSYQCSITGEHIIAFLKHLLRHVRGPIVLVWDKHPIHRRKKVQEFLAQHPRIHTYEFPTSAPELNPVEFVWTQMEDYLANSAPKDIRQLAACIRAAFRRTRESPSRLWACIYGSDLPWDRQQMRH